MTIAAMPELIGDSPKFRAMIDQVNMVAPVDSAVLLQGETGTGKELVARAIHLRSLRRHGPFVRVNCAAIPAGLLESELFGHQRGAFTGALNDTMGRFQRAHRGTLFLDEIGDLPLELQPKLLRALQEREFEKVGGMETIRVDVRIVAATNQDLIQMVRDRAFRMDLYYRLNVFPIPLPALRERPADIPALVQHFVRQFAAQMGKEVRDVPEGIMELLRRHNWPGNIRELRNFIERSVLMSPGRMLRPPLDELRQLAPGSAEMPKRTLAEMERAHITEVLQRCNWVIGGRSGAADSLGVPRTTLIARMRKLGITRSMPLPVCLETPRPKTAPIPFPGGTAVATA